MTYRAPTGTPGRRRATAGTTAEILARETPRLPARARSVCASWGPGLRPPTSEQQSTEDEEKSSLKAQLERSRKSEWEARERLRAVERALGGDPSEPAEKRAKSLRDELARLRAENAALGQKLDEARDELRTQVQERGQREATALVLEEKNENLEKRATELEQRLETLSARWERGGGRDSELEELRRKIRLFEEQRLGSERYVEERAESERALAAEVQERLSGEEGISKRL